MRAEWRSGSENRLGELDVGLRENGESRMTPQFLILEKSDYYPRSKRTQLIGRRGPQLRNPRSWDGSRSSRYRCPVGACTSMHVVFWGSITYMAAQRPAQVSSPREQWRRNPDSILGNTNTSGVNRAWVAWEGHRRARESPWGRGELGGMAWEKPRD